jgi:hypothetical protein
VTLAGMFSSNDIQLDEDQKKPEEFLPEGSSLVDIFGGTLKLKIRTAIQNTK